LDNFGGKSAAWNISQVSDRKDLRESYDAGNLEFYRQCFGQPKSSGDGDPELDD